MKKILVGLIFIFSISIFISSCKTVSQCPAYGEVHYFRGDYKKHNKRYKWSCSAYGEHKKFQKSHQREIDNCKGFK